MVLVRFLAFSQLLLLGCYRLLSINIERELSIVKDYYEVIERKIEAVHGRERRRLRLREAERLRSVHDILLSIPL